jgi:acyl-CoA thioester hydrolase
MDENLKKRILNIVDRTKVKVRFNDTDSMGIVHFKNYLVYFDDGFVSFMNNLLSPIRIEETVQKGTVFGVKKVDITYEGTAKFGDYVIVETKIIKLGKSSIIFHHKLFRESDDTLLAKVDCVRLVMDLETNKLLNVDTFFNKYLL